VDKKVTAKQLLKATSVVLAKSSDWEGGRQQRTPQNSGPAELADGPENLRSRSDDADGSEI